MPDFQKALDELLSMESEPLPQSGIEALAREQERLMASLNKKQSDIALQVDEIYEMIKDNDEGARTLKQERARRAGLLDAVMGLCDIIEDFCAFAERVGDGELARQAFMMRANAGALLDAGGVERLGGHGQALDPRIHAVKAAAASDVPREHVADVLRSGYAYMGAVLRKAAVVISAGAEGGE